jgi:predicted transposase YbfD/YdcC
VPEKIAKKIVDKGGDYLLPVKGNQGKLQSALVGIFSIHRLEDKETEAYSTSEKEHGREKFVIAWLLMPVKLVI